MISIGTVAFISLLCLVIAGIAGFSAGIRFSYWMNNIISERSDARFNEVVRYYSEKEQIAWGLQENIADLLSKKVRIESELGMKKSIFDNKEPFMGVSNSAKVTRDLTHMSEAARMERSAREEMDDDNFPSTVSASGELFKIQNRESDEN